MEDLGAWKLNAELITKVKNTDVKAMEEVFNANYKIFSGMARKFIWIKQKLHNNYNYEYNDLMQQIFIDLPFYDYSSRSALWYSIVKGTFCNCNIGGIVQKNKRHISDGQILSYNQPINSGDKIDERQYYFLDKCGSTPDAYTILMENKGREEKDEELMYYLERSIKNKRDLNALFCKLFTDLKENEITGNEYEYYKQCKIQTC